VPEVSRHPFAACNWPVFLSQIYGPEAAWACREMHLWSAKIAAKVQDHDIARLSSDNNARFLR
jgi:hypothetical protein